jgi:tetratricopeptide (TPR) repeat protein
MVTTAAAARRKARECASRATTLAEAGDLPAALDLARQAIRLDPTDAAAAATIDLLLTRQLDERIALERNRIREERTRDVEPLLDAARLARERGFVAIALQAALTAQRILPERADIAALVDEVREELTSEDHETYELAAPAATPVPPVPAATPVPGEVTGSPAVVDSGVLNWADKLRASLRRGKA